MKFICIIFLSLNLYSCSKSSDSSSASSSESVRMPAEHVSATQTFMDLVNRHRAKLGLSKLTHSNEMSRIAFEHSTDMALSLVSFGHTGFSLRCSDARSALDGGNLCAENVARGQKTAQAVFASWLNSPSHRQNLENPRVTHSGLGIAESPTGSIYWTHLFLEKK